MDTVNAIRELQTYRVAAVRAQVRLDNQARSLTRRALGWRFDMPEKERDKLNRQAAKLVKQIQGGDHPKLDTPETSVAAAVSPFIIACYAGRQPIDAHRKALEKQMIAAAKSLPVWPWVEGVKGLGALGLAIIVGEAGDLGTYDNPAKLWKRMGVGLVDGEAQRKHIDKDKAAAHGYNPRRRSALWTIGDSLLKTNDDGYKALYDTRKVEEAAKPEVKTKMHAHRRAQRYVEKRLLRDLWRAWRACDEREGEATQDRGERAW